MLKKLVVKNFKCFENEEFDFRNLTILTGENSSGKSSLIQAILLLGNPHFIGTPFNSDLLNYIQSLDINELFNKFTNIKEIYLKAKFKDDEPLEINLKKNEDKFEQQITQLNFPNRLSYSENLFYLNADRGRIKQVNQYIKNLSNKYFGINGEWIANYYEHNKRKTIEEYLIKDNSGYTLETQVNYWLKYITGIDDIEIETEKIAPTTVKSFFKYKGREFLPENVGTGLSYLFSILVICLSAKKGNIIIIENPEIHLHPKSQAKLGEFFAFIASVGIQLIIETHNDHIINKIRYEVYKNRINNTDVIFYYMQNKNPHITKLFLNKTGHWIDSKENIIEFPTGFFDATLDELLEIG
jgi:predicted ATPase